MQANHLGNIDPGIQSYVSSTLSRFPGPKLSLLCHIRSLGIGEALNLRHDYTGGIQDVAPMRLGSEIVLSLKTFT
jgi:hypothetical protein